jgi:hypothetical protein
MPATEEIRRHYHAKRALPGGASGKECQQNTLVTEFVLCSELMCSWQQVPLSTPTLLHGISKGLQPTKILSRKD